MLTGLLLVLTVAGLLAAGYGLGRYRLRQEYARLAVLRQLLQAELIALQQIQRLTAAYTAARQALRRPAA